MSLSHPPPATASLEADREREVASAHGAGGFTEVLRLAERHWARLQGEWADLTRDLPDGKLTELAERLMPPFSPEFKPSPLEIQAFRLRREQQQWHRVADHARPLAANEALGWTILSDGNPAKVMPDGTIVSAIGGVTGWTDSDGTVYRDTPEDADYRQRRHTAAIATFKRSRQYRRAVAAHRAPRRTRMTGRSRPRGQRARRHVARATSSADPGDPHEPHVAPDRPATRAVVASGVKP